MLCQTTTETPRRRGPCFPIEPQKGTSKKTQKGHSLFILSNNGIISRSKRGRRRPIDFILRFELPFQINSAIGAASPRKGRMRRSVLVLMPMRR